MRRELRRATVRRNAWSAERLNAIWEQFDQGTQRALLRLHRAADEAHLAELGAELRSVRVSTLVVWGERDPWFSPELADAYGAALPDTRIERIADAGHWPWLDQAQVIELVASFLERG